MLYGHDGIGVCHRKTGATKTIRSEIMSHTPIPKENCYVLHQGWYNDILRCKNDDFILWPEKMNTMVAVRGGIKYQNSIITEDASMIACYDRKCVWVWRKDENGNGDWINPDIQTYGTSHELIMSDLLFIEHSIPMNIISADLVVKLKDKLDELYK